MQKIILDVGKEGTIREFLLDYLSINMNLENNFFKHQIYVFLEQLEEIQTTAKIYISTINYTQGVLWHNESEDLWILVAVSERAIKELILHIPDNRKLTCLFDEIYRDIMQEYIYSFTKDEKAYIISGIKKSNIAALEEQSLYHVVDSKKMQIVSEFKEYSTLNGRVKKERIVVEGMRLVKRALDDGQMIEKVILSSKENMEEIINLCQKRMIPYFITNPGIIASMTNTRPAPEIMCSIRMKIRTHKELIFSPKRNFFLVLDGISNPDNLGMILRTADAAGISGLILLCNSTHIFHKNVIRGARGAMGRIPVYLSTHDGETISKLRQNAFKIIGTSAKFDTCCYNVNFNFKNLAVIIGNETSGIRKEILELCTDYAKIPMAAGQSSLNAAVASALLMYEYTRIFNSSNSPEQYLSSRGLSRPCPCTGS